MMAKLCKKPYIAVAAALYFHADGGEKSCCWFTVDLQVLVKVLWV